MSRKTLAITAAAFSLALVAPAGPAAASSTGNDRDGRHDSNDRWDNHRHHDKRWFAIAGVIEDIDAGSGEIRIDPRRGPDRIVQVGDFTRYRLDGDRATLGDLDVGDRAYVKGVKKHGDRYAVKIWAVER